MNQFWIISKIGIVTNLKQISLGKNWLLYLGIFSTKIQYRLNEEMNDVATLLMVFLFSLEI